MTAPWWMLIISAATGNYMFYPKICLRTYNSPISFENMKKLAGTTQRCPGHYIKIIKCIVRAKVAR
jgi:hypothetical protein